jgi:hypothetical protein
VPDAGSLLEDYKLKVSFANDLIGRLQTQFQILLTLESAIATALIVSNTGSLTPGAKWIAALEVAISVGWLAVGIAGRGRVVSSVHHVRAAGRAWAAAAGLDRYEPVGAGQRVVVIAIVGPALVTAGWISFLVWLAVR